MATAPYRFLRQNTYEWIYGNYDPETGVFTPENGGESFDTWFSNVYRFTGCFDSKGVPIFELDRVLLGDSGGFAVFFDENGEIWLERDYGWSEPPKQKERYPLTSGSKLTVDGSFATLVY